MINAQFPRIDTVTSQMESVEECIGCGSTSLTTFDAEALLIECNECGLIFDSPRPTAAAIAQFYSHPAKYDNWLAATPERDTLWHRRLKKILPLAKPGNILDIGAGIGQFLAHAKPYFSSVAGTEVSRSAIEIARNRYGIELLYGDALELELQPGSFSNITLTHVLEHVPSPNALIARCATLLNEGGRLFIAVPNDIDCVAQKVPRIALDGSISEIHLSHFRGATLRKFVESHSFGVLQEGLDPYYVASGLKLLIHQVFYFGCSALYEAGGPNRYKTLWIVAEKKGLDT
jgi:SAM-dependent methyltransferase